MMGHRASNELPKNLSIRYNHELDFSSGLHWDVLYQSELIGSIMEIEYINLYAGFIEGADIPILEGRKVRFFARREDVAKAIYSRYILQMALP